MHVRQLIYFSPRDEAPNVIQHLSSVGWKVHATSNEEQALRLIEAHDIGVGLVPLTNAAQLYHAASPWSKCDRLCWIALLPQSVRADPRYWPAVSTYFFDFHTLPVDFPRLQMTLGHADGMARLQRRQNGSDD